MCTHSPFSPVDPRPEVQDFVKRFQTRFGREPDAFNVYAYDAMVMAQAVIALTVKDTGGTDRKAIRDSFEKIRDVPSVIFGKATFDPASRRVNAPRYARLMVKGGKFVAWDGVAKAS